MESIKSVPANRGYSYISNMLNTWEDKLQCPICISPFKEPVALSCLHSFCKVCLELLVKTVNPKKISCPTCRQCTILTKKDGIEGLPRNFYIEEIYEKVR